MNLKIIGNKVKEIRKSKGLTRKELEKISGVNTTTIYEVENAKRPYSRSINKILNSLGYEYNPISGVDMVKDNPGILGGGNQLIHKNPSQMTMGLTDFRDSNDWYGLKVTREEENQLKNLPIYDDDRWLKEDYMKFLKIVRCAKKRIKSPEQKE